MYHNGSEKFWFLSPISPFFYGLKAAYDTGLPLVDSYCGRTSVSETMKALQLVSDTLIERSLLHDFPSSKPLLLITTQIPISTYEMGLVSKSKLIFSDSLLHLFELPLSSLASPFEKVRHDFFLDQKSLRHEGNLFYSSSVHQPVWVRNLAEGKPFMNGLRKDSASLELFNGIISDADTTMIMEASIWNKVFTNSYQSPEVVVREFDAKHQLLKEYSTLATSDPNNAFGWLRQSQAFKLHAAGNRIQILLRGKDIEANYLLLRPQNLAVYYNVDSDSSFWLNNFFVPAD